MKRQKPLPRDHAIRWKVLIASIAILLFGTFCYFVVDQADRVIALTNQTEEIIVGGLRVHSSSVAVQVAQPQGNTAATGREPVRHPPQKSGRGDKKNVQNSQRPKMMGPYAPLVYELLSETLFESQLIRLGILTPDENLQLPLLKALPAQLPARGRITSKFGTRKSPFSKRFVKHLGVDVAVPHGSHVKSTGDGVVVYTGWQGGYGKLVEIDHGFGIVSRYGHNQRILADVGDRVTRGQVIALAGSSGRSTGPHVHYEVLIHGQEVDPIQVMFPNTRELIAKEEAEFERQVRAGLIIADGSDSALSDDENLASVDSAKSPRNVAQGGGESGDDNDNFGVGGDEEILASFTPEDASSAPSSKAQVLPLGGGHLGQRIGSFFREPFWINFGITTAFMMLLMATLLFVATTRPRAKSLSSKA